jgi:hypothetical protein
MGRLEDVERRMRPGRWDTAGFLLPGMGLADVLAADADLVRRRGLDPEQLGRGLAELLAAGARSDFRRPVRVGTHDVEILRQRGLITCPWAPEEFEACHVGAGGLPTANRFRIKRLPSHARLDGFELSAHLIRDHGFFGGPGTRFRLEPERVIEALDLT